MAKEDDDKINDLMLSIAWNGIDTIQSTIQKIEDKANITITFAGLLMTIICGILVSLIDNIDNIHALIIFSLILDLILLVLGMYHAFKTLWLEKQEFLDILTTFKELDLANFSQAAIDFAISMGAWQERAKQIGDRKSEHLRKSMKFMMYSLIFIAVISILSAVWYLFPILHNLLIKLTFLFICFEFC